MTGLHPHSRSAREQSICEHLHLPSYIVRDRVVVYVWKVRVVTANATSTSSLHVMHSLPPLDVHIEVRPHFPAIKQYPDFIFADNAGGSQILGSSIQAISDYLVSSNVQLGGGYTHSVDAGGRVEAAKEVTALLTNVEGGNDQVVFGSSTTQLATNLGYACELSSQGEGNGEPLFGPEDEIIVTAADHEGTLLIRAGVKPALISP